MEQRDNTDLMVLSLDANALYPSLDIDRTSRIVAKRVVNSEIRFDEVNYKWAATYVALNMERLEVTRRGLHRVVPRKRATGGKDPTILTIGVDQKKERWKWNKMPDQYTPLEKRKIMEVVVEILIKATFDNHFYKWGQEIYRQLEGGAIGLRATGSVARAIMGHIMEVIRGFMVDNGMPVHLLKKYVDDILIITDRLSLGARYSSGKIVTNQKDVDDDVQSGKSREQVTYEVPRRCQLCP